MFLIFLNKFIKIANFYKFDFYKLREGIYWKGDLLGRGFTGEETYWGEPPEGTYWGGEVKRP